MGRMLGRRFGAALLLIGATIGVLGVIALLRHKGLDWAVKFSAIAVVALGVTGPLVGPVARIAHWLRRPQPPTPEEIISARNNLQAALSGAWSEEGSEVYEYEPMQVRFAPWTGAVDSQGPYDSSSADVPAAEKSQAGDGDFDSVADVFSQEPRYRRVVLGEAGAGKTVLVTELQRKLVEAPRPGDPLPVIVPVAAWKPDKQSLLDWLAERLTTDYGWLPVAHARALVARGMVLPILDGLDEMPRSLRSDAIVRINKHHMYRPLVVTSREKEYRDAVGQNPAVVKNSVAVAVQPLRPADARRYLDPAGSGRWAEVLGEMDANSGELARVLANPLMLWLARVEYEGKSPNNLTLFGSGRSIRRYLLDQFVPAVYAGDSVQSPVGQFRWTAQQAKRWLGHLGAPVLAWWMISEKAGRWRWLGIALRAAVLCSVAAILGIWVLERHGNWRHGAFSGPVNLSDLLLGGPVGRLIRPVTRTLAMNVKGPTLRDLTSGSHVIDGVFSHTFLLILALFVISVIVTAGKPPLVPMRLQFRARRVLRALIRCCVLFGLAALGSLLLLKNTHWPVSAAVFFRSRSTWIALVAVSLLGLISIPRSFAIPSETSGNLSPEVSFRLDRQADLVVTVSRQSAVAVALWLFCGAQIAFAYVVYAITATVVAVILGGQNTFASRAYNDARIWLAAQGRAPWRIMDFLADANRRGVLRQVGAAYQFRHIRLQQQVGDWRRSPARLDEWKSRLGELADMVRERIGWRREETPVRIGEDGTRRWWSAQAGPDAVLPEFAKDLDDLAAKGWWSDKQARAAALRNLLDDYQTLAETDPATLKPGLARALRDSASAFPWDEALCVTRKAVDCYRELTQTDPVAFLPGLAEAVSDLVVRLSWLDRLEEARCLITDIVNTARRWAEADPATFLPVLAYSLSDLSDWLWRWTSQAKQSVSARREAAAIYRELTEADPARFARSLTSSLYMWAFMFAQLERRRDELTAIRYAFDAYRKRAERIAKIRREIAESDLAIVWQYRQEPAAGKRLFGRTRSEQRQKALAAARRAADTFGKLAESRPAQFLPDLAEAATGLAAELKSAGKRREARILTDETDRIRSQYRRSVGVTRREVWEVQPLDGMDGLALRLWKLGVRGAAVKAAQISRDLAPASRAGAATVNLGRHSPARLLSRIREEREVRSRRKNVRFWRNRIRNLQLAAGKDPDAWRYLARAQQDLADALAWQGDALDTLAFHRRVAGQDDDADTAMRQANAARQEAADIDREVHSNLLPGDRSDLPKSSGTLALRLEASGGRRQQ